MDKSLTRTTDTFPEDQPDVYLGNGLIGYRVRPNPFTSRQSFVSGFVREHDPGRFETFANAPYPLAMDFRLDKSPWSISERGEEVDVVSQSLDMSRGELATRMRMPLGDGVAEVSVLQFVSRSCPVLSCQEVRLTVPTAGELVIRPSITSGSETVAQAEAPFRSDEVIDLMATYTAAGRQSVCGVAAKIDLGGLNAKRGELAGDSRELVLSVQPGQEVVIRTIAATLSSLYHPDTDLEACRLANWGSALGFEQLRSMNARAWAEIWKSRVKVTGDDRAQTYLDNALFYLFSSAHPACRTSIPPFGLSHIHYNGHIFWDTDTYETPVLALVSPETAKATVDYRLRCLEAAKTRAAYYGFGGAMYPWESDTKGFESTPSHCSTGWLEQHINPCVAFAAWQYQQAAGDGEYAVSTTWPIVKAVAQWIEGRVEKTERGYEIRAVVGSDEGAVRNNSSYTNGLCAEVLRIACRCAEMIGRSPNPKWAEIADAMLIPTGPAPGAEGDIVYLDDGGASSGCSTDSFIIGFPFDLPLDRDLLRRTYDYFFSYNKGGICMGHSLHVGDGAFLGDRKGSRWLLHRIIDDCAETVWGMGTEYTGGRDTCFLTTMAGLLQSAMLAFTGIRFEPGNWTKYEACLPEGWERIEIERIYLGMKAYHVLAEHGKKAELTEIS